MYGENQLPLTIKENVDNNYDMFKNQELKFEEALLKTLDKVLNKYKKSKKKTELAYSMLTGILFGNTYKITSLSNELDTKLKELRDNALYD